MVVLQKLRNVPVRSVLGSLFRLRGCARNADIRWSKLADLGGAADACLVRMSELYERSRVLTLDSDSHIDRRHGRKVIPLLRPA